MVTPRASNEHTFLQGHVALIKFFRQVICGATVGHAGMAVGLRKHAAYLQERLDGPPGWSHSALCDTELLQRHHGGSGTLCTLQRPNRMPVLFLIIGGLESRSCILVCKGTCLAISICLESPRASSSGTTWMGLLRDWCLVMDC